MFISGQESHAAHKCIIQVSLGHSFFMPGFDLGLDFTSILENGISYVKDIKFSQLIKILLVGRSYKFLQFKVIV